MSQGAFTTGMLLIAEAEALRATDVLGATAKAYQALHAFQAVPTRRGMGLAQLLLGEFSLFTADLAESRDHWSAARDMFADIPLPELEARARRGLAEVLIRLDDFDAARVELEAALRILENRSTPTDLAEIHRRLGSLERRCGNLQPALGHYQVALDGYSKLGDPEGMAGVLLSFGNTLAAVGADEAALEAYAHSRHLFKNTGDRLGQANAERFYAASARRLGQADVAAKYFRRALEGYTDVGDILGESFVRQALGELATESGDLEGARQELRQAVELFARTCDPISIVTAVTALADGYLAEGDERSALEAMSWGVAEARQAARWAVSAARRDVSSKLIAGLENRALELAVRLGDGVLAGTIMEAAVAGIVGLLPILLDAPESPDPKVEALRRRVRDLARQLSSRPLDEGAEPSPDDEEPAGETPADPGTPPTRGPSGNPAVERDEIIDQLEKLLGRRAREVISPTRIDHRQVVLGARRRQAVLQYSCPGGIAEGAPLYVVWSTPGESPQISRVRLSAEVADRLNVLRGARLLAPAPAAPRPDEVPVEVQVARGLGLVAEDSTEADQARQIARRTYELWTLLDREPNADPTVADLASALFPPAMADWLTSRQEGLPPRVLIIPGPRLWNLPWSGLVIPGGPRLVTLARVSLAPSLSSARSAAEEPAFVRTVAAWIPPESASTVKGTPVERAMVQAIFGPRALSPSAQDFLIRLGEVDAAFTSVHGQAAVGLAHGIYLAPNRILTAADLIAVDLPRTLVIGACWSSRVDPEAEPYAIPLVAHARGAADIIGGIFPLPDASPFPTARLLAQLYTALHGTDPATALWLAQHEAHLAGAAPHTWAGVIHSTVLFAEE